VSATAYDVLVIGAGIAGASLARELSRAGMSVLVVDRSSPGGGSTGVAAGGVRTAFSTTVNQGYARRTMRQLVNLAEASGRDLGFQAVGYLFLVSDPSSLAVFEAMATDQVVTRIPVADLPSLVPGIQADSLVGAYLDPLAGHLDSYELLLAIGDEARRMGTGVRYYATVAALRQRGGKVVSTLLGDGTEVSSGVVVNAAGVWCGQIAGMLGMSLPIEPAAAEVHFVDGPGIPVPGIPLTVDFDCDRTYFHRHGSWLAAGTATYGTPPLGAGPPPGSAVTERLVRRLSQRLPSLERSAIHHCQAGWLEITPDDNPMVGWYGAENHYVFAGFSGHGLSLAPSLAEDAAAEIAAGSDTSALEAFSPLRFQDHARRFGREAVALR
jgi:sarcosine oxidase, subunit beta